MQFPVVMPQLGLTMTEGSVSTWLKKPGEWVGKGEMLFVVSTDKADMEVESLDEGELVQVVAEPGTVVPVGSVIAYFKGKGADAIPEPSAATLSAAPAAPRPVEGRGAEVAALATGKSDSGHQSPPVSPRARKLARQLGIDLSKLKASRPGGRIVEDDVKKFAAGSDLQAAPPEALDLHRRKIIAERLTQSIQNIPHFSVTAEVKAEQLVLLRESLLSSVEKQAGLKLTVTDLLLKTMGLALAETPEIMLVWEDGKPRRYATIDAGLAINTERGVVAPVLRQLDVAPLVEIAKRRHRTVERARQRRLALADFEGGIGTLSNLGMYRVDHFQAIISPGQSFVLAVGRIETRPWVEKGALTAAPTLVVSLSVDHRVADGAVAGMFLGRIAEILENPYRLIWGAG